MSGRSLFRTLVVVVICLSGWEVRAAEPERPEEERQVLIEMRIVQVSEKMGERFRTLAGFTDLTKAAARKVSPSAQLTREQVRTWIGLMQENASTSLHGSPRMMVLNKQPCSVQVGASSASDGSLSSGYRFDVHPHIANDGTSINMSARLEVATPTMVQVVTKSKLDGEESQEVERIGMEEKVERFVWKDLVAVPKDQTVVYYLGKKLAESRTETHPHPVLARIPYLNRLTRNVGYGREAQELYLFVTGRVVEEK